MDVFLSKSNILRIVVFAFAVVLIMKVIGVFPDRHLNHDEYLHHWQSQHFANGHTSLNREITMIPGYHAVTSLVMRLTGDQSLDMARTVSALFGLISVIMFFFSARALDPPSADLKTAQYALFPIILPMFFVAYTDAFSIALILTMAFFVIRNKPNVAALFLFASILVRQSNILWLLFILMYVFLKDENRQINIRYAVQFAIKNWASMITGLAFVVFYIVNDGVAIGDKVSHVFGLYFGNVIFLAALVGFLFLPQIIGSRKKLIYEIKSSPVTFISLFVFMVFIYVKWIAGDFHRYNGVAGFLRNEILIVVREQLPYTLAFFVFLVIGATWLLSLAKRNSTLAIIIVIGFLSVVPSFLIEQRYYIVFATLLLLFREPLEKKYEYASIIFLTLPSAAIIWAISTQAIIML